MTKKECKKLRSKLPRGYVKRLIKETGASSATILRVLRGDSFNHSVIDAAIRLAAEHQEAIKAQQNQIESL